MAELSTKPYLIRAIHEWCTDCGYRPHIAVVVDERTVVPREFVRNGEIVLNVSAMATNRLQISNELIEFEARFGGVARHVSIPIDNVSAIYAQETGHGMAFEVPKALALVPESQEAADSDQLSGASAPSAVEKADTNAGESGQGADEAARARRRPRLAAVPSPAPASEPPRAPKRRRKEGAPRDASDGAPGAGETAVDKSAGDPAAGDGVAGESAADTRRDSASIGPGSAPTAADPDTGAPGASRSRGTRTRASTRKTGADTDSAATPPGDEPSPPPGGRPRLTRVK